MKRLVVGDIHGCYAELMDLLDKAALDNGDQVVALGDVVDRGPDSPRVLDFFRNSPNAISLLGNHERKHIRCLEGIAKPSLSQVITRNQIGEADYPHAVAFMRTFPAFLDLPEALLIHGCWEPGKPLSGQAEEVTVGTLAGERELQGRLDRPWYELYDGDKPLVAGHHDYLGEGKPLIIRERVYCIDTGCCHGKALTGLLLPDFKILSVPSREDYWRQNRLRNADLSRRRLLDGLSWEKAERLLSAAATQASMPESVEEQIEAVRELTEDAEHALGTLLHHALSENQRVLKGLGREGRYDTLSPEDKGCLYASRIAGSPIAPFLHLARKGRLTMEELKRRFDRPSEALAFLSKMGLPSEKTTSSRKGSMEPAVPQDSE